VVISAVFASMMLAEQYFSWLICDRALHRRRRDALGRAR
jgi:hypothetical protein